MNIDLETLITFGKVIGGLITVGGAMWAIAKWIFAQNKQTEEIAELKKQHEEDMENFHKQEAEKNKLIQDELCVISYALLAALDGLKQQGSNGEVTKAHEKLEKHINQQAHGQK